MQYPLQVLASNPRYFSEDGTHAVLLGGSYSGYEFTTNGWGADDIDFDAYLDFLQQRGLNHIRLWLVESTRVNVEKPLASPIPYARSGTCCAGDGGKKFDLNKFNPDFFNRLRDRVQRARDRGIYVSVLLFDKWSAQKVTKGKAIEMGIGHPYAKGNNINNVDADPNGAADGTQLRSLSNTAVLGYQKAFVAHVVDTVNDLNNVLYEVANEEVAESKDWQNAIADYIHSYEKSKPKQHPVGISQFKGSNAALYTMRADYISPESSPWNGLSNPYLIDPPLTDGSRVVLLDTDHIGAQVFLDASVSRNWVWKSITRG